MTVLRKLLIFKLVVCCLAAAELSHAQGLRPIHARKAMVVSIHPQASQVGADILRQGGNAVDAAVATGTLGAFWGIVYLRRRSVVAPVVSHSGFNLLQILQFLATGR